MPACRSDHIKCHDEDDWTSPQYGSCLLTLHSTFSIKSKNIFSLVQLIIFIVQVDDSWLKDSIFWTTPRNRRTLEKRWKRRFGCPTWGVYFGPRINKRIRVDHKTGEYFELGKLAPQTYKKVMDETRRIQKKMADSFGVGLPKDEETLVIYKGETQSNSSGGRIVEMDYERPSFFSQNLMEKEHGRPGGSQETVRPSRLG